MNAELFEEIIKCSNLNYREMSSLSDSVASWTCPLNSPRPKVSAMDDDWE
jgi:hypothetical protein